MKVDWLREFETMNLFTCAVMLALVSSVAGKVNPTCGIGCDYLGSESFAFNCEAFVYHKGEVYNYNSYMISCADKR